LIRIKNEWDDQIADTWRNPLLRGDHWIHA
jgi:hypothetical protein